jgi:hypothetical protein
MQPRFLISDLLTIMAASGVGIWFVRSVLGINVTVNAQPTLLAILLGVVVPCLAGGLIVGHPAIIALQLISYRRPVILSAGEVMGLVPFVSIAIVVFCWLADNYIVADAWGWVVFGTFWLGCLANVVAGVFAAVYFLDRLGGPVAMRWTDIYGAAAAVLGGSLILATFLAVFSLH